MIKDLILRRYDESDFQTLKMWLDSHGFTELDSTMLPRIGFVVEGICAGFLYQTDSTFALFDWIVGNPEASKEDRIEGLKMLLQFALDEAGSLGFSKLYTSAQSAESIERYLIQGYIKPSMGMVSLESETSIADDITKALQMTEQNQSPEKMRALITQLEASMLELPDHGTELPVNHHFCNGIYMRELFIPKGHVLTGKIHKTENLNILSQGDLSVWTEEGMKRLKASTVIKSQPGIKRVGYAHEDSVWITIHQTHETDLEKIEEAFIAKSFNEIPGFTESMKLVGEK